MAEADLRLQTSQSTLRFDFDNESADGLTVPVAGLRHFSKALDYALLDLVEPVDRPIPALSPELVVTNATSYVAVNVVQHPRGEHKQIALRNNLVSGADATTVRYLADTDYGSSGSPVCDDKWRVVALHRDDTRIGPRLPRQERGLRQLREPDPGRSLRCPQGRPDRRRGHRCCASALRRLSCRRLHALVTVGSATKEQPSLRRSRHEVQVRGHE